jgi:imidazolonepropionase-like amidohydrolase
VSGVEASNAGQKCFEHLHGIPLPFQPPEPQLIPTLLRNGTWVDPTLTPYWTRAHMDELIAAKDDPRLKYLVPSLREEQWDPVLGQKRNPSFDRQMLQWRMDQVRMLYQNGIPLLAGTDLGSPYVYPGEIDKEMELFVEAGLSPLDALRTATINPARYLDREKVLGSVEYGKYADLVVLDANPLDDIHNVEKVDAVILNGRYLTRDDLEKMLPAFQ